MVLIDQEKGTLTQADDFIMDPGYGIQIGSKDAPYGDIFRVHDYNYLMKIIKLTEYLKLRGDDK